MKDKWPDFDFQKKSQVDQWKQTRFIFDFSEQGSAADQPSTSVCYRIRNLDLLFHHACLLFDFR